MARLPLPAWLLAMLAFAPSQVANAARPNVLVILADDLGYGELGCQGNPQIPTPHIDSIAKKGTRFTSGYVSGPYCSPTRAGLLTGRYQQRYGHEFNPGPATAAPSNFGLSLKEVPLPERMKRAGYATGMFGKWHLGYRPAFHPQQRGFDEFVGFLGGAHSYLDAKADSSNPLLSGTKPLESFPYTTEGFAREAVAFLERHKNEPWFIYLPFNAVHGPLQAKEAVRARFASITDARRRTFASMLSSLDDAVGEVLGKIRALGQEENTLVVFVSDNGGPTLSTTSGNGPLHGYKGQVWEGGIRVPFMMQWPGHIPAGRVHDNPVIQLDVVPTVLAAAGVEPGNSARLDGVDLLPYLSDKVQGSPHASLFWRFGKQRAVRSGDWKLTDMGEGAKLFNLAKDLGETQDLAAEEPAKLRELEAAYAAWNQDNVPPTWGGAGTRAATKAARKAANRAASKAAAKAKRKAGRA